MSLGFVGLGVMGSRMCANLIRKSGQRVVVYDPMPEATEPAAALGADVVPDLAALEADVVFLSLPTISEVESVAGILAGVAHKPRVLVDMGTSEVGRSRALASRLADDGVVFADAPVARTRQAAEDGTLLITVGAPGDVFETLRPLLECMGTDVVHAGGVGNGQVLKILNNMVLFLTMNALAEALAIGRAAGVDGEALFSALTLGSADSFALRRTGTATMLPDEFPERAFPTDYAIKDLALALQLAEDGEVPAHAAQQTMDLLRRTSDAGYGPNYYPVMIKLVDGRG
ncbi:NAD(P)-dependent oxidoreductase [Cryptosporangium sp. NPDC051539]|uniref:NAD(P)-dependent oxidoreductase n=1 Tax=Cryptosporangium sp. NPDC051539 TaxID=3363962 RepID=UPI0037B9E607